MVLSSIPSPLGLCALLAAGACLHALFLLLVCPLLSPLRNLPKPNQGSVWRRLFYEPRVSEIETWIDELPHNGIIRYHGIFNRERIFIASPEGAKDLLTTSAYKTIKPKPQWILANNIASTGLLIQEGDEHKHARKQLNPSFSPAQMKKWFPSLWNTTIEVIEALPSHTKQTHQQTVDSGLQSSMAGVTSILKLTSAASIDMIGHFGYNVDFNTLKDIEPKKTPGLSGSPRDSMVKFGRAYIQMFKTTWRGQRTLEAASIIGPKLALNLPLRAVRTIDSIMRLVRKTAEEIVSDHEQAFAAGEGKDLAKDDMISMVMKTGRLSHEELVRQSVHFFAAGTETVAGSVCWAIHLLSRHPAMQTRVRNEIRANIPSPYLASADPVSQSQFHRLKYLNAIIQEVLRFHSINTLLWRESIQPVAIAGVSIPKGTTIVYSPWTLNRDPKHWGPDGRFFRPERWLDTPSGGADHSYSFLTFGGGPRRCIGEQYARDEMLCLVAALIARYQFTPISLHQGSDEGQEIGDNFALTLFKIYEGWELNVEKIPGW